MAPSRLLKLHKIIQVSDYTITTWVLLGATVQCLLTLLLPTRLALFPPILLLIHRILRGYLAATGYIPNLLSVGVNYSRTTVQIPSPSGSPASQPSNESLVVMVLTSTFTHPNGRFSPGGADLGPLFIAMWADAAANRETYGYLGNTPAMVAEPSSLYSGPRNGDDRGKTMLWLSYWKTLDGLRAFAHAGLHRRGWDWWESGGTGRRFGHIGVAHEVYGVPGGGWGCVAHNFRAFGLGE